VICRVVLIVHSIGLLGDLLALLVSGNDSGIALYSNPLLMGNSLVSIVCSIGMLKGMGWARYGYLLRTGALWIFPFFPGAAGGSMPLGFYILLILWDLTIIFFLYRPKTNAFFALAWASSVVGDQELEKDT